MIMDCRFLETFLFLFVVTYPVDFAVVKIQFFGEVISWLLGMRRV